MNRTYDGISKEKFEDVLEKLGQLTGDEQFKREVKDLFIDFYCYYRLTEKLHDEHSQVLREYIQLLARRRSV